MGSYMSTAFTDTLQRIWVNEKATDKARFDVALECTEGVMLQ
jgi:hypothetical protein